LSSLTGILPGSAVDIVHKQIGRIS
jgi:hypothetical protein